MDNIINVQKKYDVVQDSGKMDSALRQIKLADRPGMSKPNVKVVTFDNMVYIVMELVQLMR